MSWTEAEAEAAWLDDLELESAAAALAARRLAEDGGGPREQAYRDAARRWLGRGQGLVALSLLDRGALPPLAPPSARPPARAAQADAWLAAMPGSAGLPALTEEEAEALRAATEADEALAVLKRARRRLESHASEARRLLGRWVERQG